MAQPNNLMQIPPVPTCGKGGIYLTGSVFYLTVFCYAFSCAAIALSSGLNSSTNLASAFVPFCSAL